MANFKPGDVVELKSGSLRMTVTSVEENEVYVAWFDKESKPQKGNYEAAALKLAENRGEVRSY